jgi:hypothetical protein
MIAKHSDHALRASLIFGCIVTILSTFPGPGFSQAQSLTVTTDRTAYAAGDKANITGTIPHSEQPGPVIMQVFDPSSTAIFTSIPAPNGSGEFLVEIDTKDWQLSGTYLVHVTFADQDAETSFDFTGLDSRLPIENLLVTFSDGTSRSIDAQMTNGVITQITAQEETATLIISMATRSENGELTIVLPRQVIDSQFEPDETGLVEDDSFLVLVDGEFADYNETATSAADRTLKISIPSGTRQVMLEGTSIVPEFTQVAAILISAMTMMTAVLVVSSKRFLPR